MADEKLNTGQEQTEQSSLFDTGPEVPAPEPPALEVKPPEQATVETDEAPGGVVVSAEQIEKLMAEGNAAVRAEVDKTTPAEPEQPPAPAPEKKATEENARAGNTAPAP